MARDDDDLTEEERQQQALADMLAQDLATKPVDVEPFRLEDGTTLPPLEILKETYKTKSAVIRYLSSLGANVKEISAYTGIRYQHVRNVVTTPLKRGPNEDWRPKPKT